MNTGFPPPLSPPLVLDSPGRGGDSVAFPLVWSNYPTPGDRANPPMQWRVGQAAARLSGPQHRLIASVEVAGEVPAGTGTVTEVLRFLTTIALFESTGDRYAVTDIGWAIFRGWQEDQTQARLLLQGQFLRHWPAAAAWQALHDAPVDQDVLARRLHQNLSGTPRRGQYLVEWLVMALLVYRDEDMRISPAPALAAASGTQPPAAASQSEPDALLGLTNRELRALPPSRYCAVLDGLTRLLEHTAGTS
jgi:hypothetical protein